MTTQMQAAKAGKITKEMKFVAKYEGIEEDILADRIAKGEAIILYNKIHKTSRPIGIGKGLRTKVNANLGTSSDNADLEYELKKLHIAQKSGTDTVMDLSTGGDLDKIRRAILKKSTVVLGTVPVYQTAVEAITDTGSLIKMRKDAIFETIEKHCRDGVDFITVHCGVTRETLKRLKLQPRITNIVSRGAAFHTTWMMANDCENPLYEQYDRLLEISRKYDIVLSLGDGLRPGCLKDATDRSQIQELILLGELAQRAWDADVQVMIEGPGHLPLNEIQTNILLQKKLCSNAPFYVLGPLVTDIAPGYDHITSAIGGACAAWYGADFLCYVTPSEHLRLPTLEDVKHGVITSRIAAHAGDIAKGYPGAIDMDNKMAYYREKRDWDKQISLSIDPETARKMRKESKPSISDVCTMCGEYCSIKMVEKTLKK